MPAQKPGTSEQTVETPADFLAAVIAQFGGLEVDLACTEANSKAPIAHTEEIDRVFGWEHYKFGNLWLNPPFGKCGEFARRSWEHVCKHPHARILMLVPASVGSNWFREHVHGKAGILALSPRLKFVGHASPFPKDLMLCVYGGWDIGFGCWRWKP